MFSIIWRWIKEHATPASRRLKCARVGHKVKTITARVLLDDDDGMPRTVATECTANVDVCARCHEYVGSPYNCTDKEWLSGISMPKEDMRQFKKKGFYVK